jgi:hypothetical protein
MRFLAVLLLAVAVAGPGVAECIPFEKAAEHVGSTACVQGTVVKVVQTRTGNFHMDFCQDYHGCPFNVFVPARSLHNVGDVRQLEGKPIEIHGKVRSYNSRAEIVLKDVRQLRGEAARIPPAPKAFDAEQRGNFKAGKYSAPRSSTKNGTSTATSGSSAQ